MKTLVTVTGREAEGLLKGAIAQIEPEILFIESFSDQGSLLMKELCSEKDSYLAQKARKVGKMFKGQAFDGDQVLDLVCGIDVVFGLRLSNGKIVRVGIDLTINKNTSVLSQKAENLMRSHHFLKKHGVHKAMVLLWENPKRYPPLQWTHILALLKLPNYSVITI